MVEGEFGSSLFCNPSSSFFCFRLGERVASSRKRGSFSLFPVGSVSLLLRGEREEGGGIVFRPEKRAALFGAGNRMISSSETFYCSESGHEGKGIFIATLAAAAVLIRLTRYMAIVPSLLSPHIHNRKELFGDP